MVAMSKITAPLSNVQRVGMRVSDFNSVRSARSCRKCMAQSTPSMTATLKSAFFFKCRENRRDFNIDSAVYILTDPRFTMVEASSWGAESEGPAGRCGMATNCLNLAIAFALGSVGA